MTADNTRVHNCYGSNNRVETDKTRAHDGLQGCYKLQWNKWIFFKKYMIHIHIKMVFHGFTTVHDGFDDCLNLIVVTHVMVTLSSCQLCFSYNGQERSMTTSNVDDGAGLSTMVNSCEFLTIELAA